MNNFYYLLHEKGGLVESIDPQEVVVYSTSTPAYFYQENPALRCVAHRNRISHLLGHSRVTVRCGHW